MLTMTQRKKQRINRTLTPVYAKNTDNHRIAYVANGNWRLQEAAGAGTKASDCWHNISPPLSREAALASLARYNKELKPLAPAA